MNLMTEKAKVYWLNNLEEEIKIIINKWEKFIQAQIPKSQDTFLKLSLYFNI